MLHISQFEARVFEWIATQSHDLALQAQLARIQIAERQYTGVGCYTKLAVPIDAPVSIASYSQRGPLGGPHFESPAVEYGGGTLLWFCEGRADCLEIYAHGDSFPEDHAELGDFKFS